MNSWGGWPFAFDCVTGRRPVVAATTENVAYVTNGDGVT